MYYAKRDEGVHLPLEELEETLTIVSSPENIAFGKLLKLYKMRDALPEDSKFIWDDAFLSLSNNNSDKENYRSSDIQLPKKVYYKLKESFKSIIYFILKE